MFSVISTRKDLAKIYHCKIYCSYFSNFKYCRVNSDPVVRMGLANCRNYTGEIWVIHKQSTTSSYTIGNNKREILISLLCHLRATPMCESTIKVFKNNKQLPRACVRAKTTLLSYCSIFFSCVNTNCIDCLICQHNKRTISKRFAPSLIAE